jgi:hypothetical protein
MTQTTSIGNGALRLQFDLTGGLAAARNLSALSARLVEVPPRAIATVRRRLPVQARRDIQAEYALPARRVNQDLTARQTDSGVRLVGRFRGIGLMQFNAREATGGVRATVLRGRRNLRKDAFIAPGLGSNVQVFQRAGAKREMRQGRYAGKQRQPLVAEYGASVAQMLAKGRRPERLVDFARGVLAAEVDRLLRISSAGVATGSTPA